MVSATFWAATVDLEFYLTGTTSQLLAVRLFVDNVKVRECATPGEPTTWGRVKATYR